MRTGSWKSPAHLRGFPLDLNLAGNTGAYPYRLPGRPEGLDVKGDAQLVLWRGHDLRVRSWRPSLAILRPREAPPPARPWSYWVQAGAILAVLLGVSTLAEWPLWRQIPTLAAVNLATSVAFILTGLLLRQERGSRGVAWALILAGLFRSVDFVDAWNAGAWPAYAVVFGAADRVCGAYALLRYPRARLSPFQRGYLITLVSWMLVGRSLIVVTTTVRANGYPATAWWPTLIHSPAVGTAVQAVVDSGEAVLGLTLLVLLTRRLLDTVGLDRVVLAPIIVAGLAAVVAASATAVSQIYTYTAAGPTNAFLVEGVVDVTLPLAFLAAVIQRGLLARNLAELTARIAAGADLGSVRHALQETLHDPTLQIVDVSENEGSGEEDGITGSPSAGLADAVAALTPAQLNHRLVEVIRTDAGAPIAVVIADAALARYRGLFDAAVRTSGLALQNAQLQAQAAQAELDHVRASRTRIVEAALAERRRLERDLHDG